MPYFTDYALQQLVTEAGRQNGYSSIIELCATAEDWHDGRRTAMYKFHKAHWRGEVFIAARDMRRLRNEADKALINLTDALREKEQPRLEALRDYAARCLIITGFVDRCRELAAEADRIGIQHQHVSGMLVDAFSELEQEVKATKVA